MVEKLDCCWELKKGVRNLGFLTTLVPRRHVTATCLTLRQLASYNGQLPLFPTLATLPFVVAIYIQLMQSTWYYKTHPWHLIYVYLFPPTQQVETEHETVICRNLRQPAASAVFCQVYWILPSSARITAWTATRPQFAVIYGNLLLLPYSAIFCQAMEFCQILPGHWILLDSARTTTWIIISPTPFWPNL